MFRMRIARHAFSLVSAAVALCAFAPVAGATPPQVYWGTGDSLFSSYWGSVARVSSLGGSGDRLDTGDVYSGNSIPSDVAYDQTRGRIVWADFYCACFGSANLDFSDARRYPLPALTVGLVHAFAIDPETERLYWVNVNNRINWTALDESGEHGSLEIGSAPIDRPTGIAIDPVSRRIYWSNWLSGAGVTEKIGWASLDPGGPSGGFGEGLDMPDITTDLSIDSQRNRIVFSDGDAIKWVSTDGSSSGDVVTDPVVNFELSGARYDAASDSVFWSNGYEPEYPIARSASGGAGPAGEIAISGIDLSEHPTTSPVVVPGAAAWVAPAKGLDFGEVFAGAGATATKTLDVRSTAFDPIDVESVSLTGPDAASFGMQTSCGGELDAGNSCGVALTFLGGSQVRRFEATVVVATSTGDFNRRLTVNVLAPTPLPIAGPSVPARCVDLGGKKRPKVRFSLATAATLTVRLERRVSRRGAPMRCPRAGATGKGEARKGRVRKVTTTGRSGLNTIDIRKLFRLKASGLAPGHYRVTIVVRNEFGATSRAVSRWFWVLRR